MSNQKWVHRPVDHKKEYNAWKNMHDRCYNVDHKFYDRYGRRGLTVCERWFSFDNFYDDMGPAPDGLTLGRIENDKGYSLDNCEWQTWKRQGADRPSQHFLTWQGETKPAKVWARELGIPYMTVLNRIRAGCPTEVVLDRRSMRGKSYPIYEQSQPTEEQPLMASNILGEDSSGFDFEYDSSIEDATPPEPLPEREYIGEIVEARKGASNFSGNDQLVCIIVIPVENFPVDYSPENAPDGMRLVWFSPDVDKSRKGKWQMHIICQKLGVPMTNRFRAEDFVGKKVRVELGHKTGQDEVTYNVIRGTPSLAT